MTQIIINNNNNNKTKIIIIILKKENYAKSVLAERPMIILFRMIFFSTQKIQKYQEDNFW